jgi:hypothetical protein
MRLPRTVILGGLILLTPLLLTSLASILLILNSVNPMQLTFVTEFRVENQTTRPLWVTPIGTFNTGGKCVLPQFATSVPAIPAVRSRDLRLEPGGSTWIIYDWDDLNFSEIVVRDARGEYRQLVVDPDPPKRNYYRNKRERYVIEEWESLPAATANVLAAALNLDRQWWIWGLFAIGLIVMGLYRWLYRVYRLT